MAVQTFDPGCSLKVDCLAVKKGSQRDLAWASAPNRKFARAWGPIAVALEDDVSRVTWMPAHCSLRDTEHKQLGDGSPLTAAHVRGNDLVDTLAKQIARRDQVPRSQVHMVQLADKRIKAIAMWIGRATAYANNFPAPDGMQKRMRDAEGARAQRRRGIEKKAAQPQARPASIWDHPRMMALRQRVRDRGSSG